MPAEPRSWRSPRWRFVLSLSAALIVHIGLLLVIREALQRRPAFDPPTSAAMELRLIDVTVVETPRAVAVPEISRDQEPLPKVAAAESSSFDTPPKASVIDAPSPAPVAVPGRVDTPERVAATTVEPASPATAATSVAPPPAIAPAAVAAGVPGRPDAAPSTTANASAGLLPRERQPRLVLPDGTVLLPEVDVAVAAAAARFPARRVVRPGGSNPLARHSPLPYVATRFDPMWVPDGETLLGTLLRKLEEKLTKRSSGQVAGLQVDCVWILVVAGCSWGVPPRISIDELKKMRADVPMPRGPRTQPGG